MGVVIDVLEQLFDKEQDLRRVWDQEAFMNARDVAGARTLDQDDQDALNVTFLTRTIHSNLWWAFAHMLHLLHSIAQCLQGWAEGHKGLQP